MAFIFLTPNDQLEARAALSESLSKLLLGSILVKRHTHDRANTSNYSRNP